MKTLLWGIFLPMIAALLTPLVGRALKRHIGWFAVAASAASAILFLSFAPAIGRSVIPTWQVNWPAPELGIQLAFFADGYGWMFALIVSIIGTLICLYAQYYLHDNEPRTRFFAYILLFEAAMLGVVLSANLFAMVVFWELTSVASFLLIGFWHEQERARYGAYKALLITGLGGLALLAGVILVYVTFGTADLRTLFDRAGEIKAHPLFPTILVLFLLGAFTKSAQFPFHLWLPDAMQAPTPVSAFLHSATMVKAGVFLLGRIHPIFSGTTEWFWIVSSVGMATMLLGAYAAVRKHDLKALLAYSTISQLGLITLLYGFGTELAVVAATFHILNHAAFKAGLFLVVGIVDHETGTRDKRALAGLAKAMPMTAAVCGACALASAGVPLLNGFLSKELFYEVTIKEVSTDWLTWLWPALAVGGSIFTFVYSMEVFHGVFFGGLPKEKGFVVEGRHANSHHKPHDPHWGMLLPAGVLAAVCVAVGLWPAGLAHSALTPAVTAVLQKPYEFHVALWHGINAPLMMSALTLAAGLVIYAQRQQLTAVQQRIAWRFNATTIYDACLAGLMSATTQLTDTLQSGRMRHYFWWAAGLMVVGVGVFLWSNGTGSLLPQQFTHMEHAELVLGCLLILATLIVVALHKQRLAAVISLGSVGFLISVLYLVLSAPDLALTQLLIETVTIIIFILVLRRLPQKSKSYSSRSQRGADALLAATFGGVISLLVLAVAAAPPGHTVAEYFLENSKELAGGRNVVNVILVDFRGFDTLGEITVLAIAALGAYALIKIRHKKEEAK